MSKIQDFLVNDPVTSAWSEDEKAQLAERLRDPAMVDVFIANHPLTSKWAPEEQRQLGDMFKAEAKPSADDVTWGQTLESAVKNIIPTFEAIPPAVKFLANDIMGDEAGKARAQNELKQIRAYQQQITPPGLQDPSFTAKSIVHGTVSQLPLQIANMALYPLTGGAGPLALMGAESAVQAYPEYREAGFSPTGAAVGASTIGAVEVLTEKMGLDSFFKGAGGSFYKRMLNVALSNAGEEGVAQILQGTQNNMALRGMPFGIAFTDAAKQVPNAMGVGALTGVAIGGPLHPFQAKQIGNDLRAMDAELKAAESEIRLEPDPEARALAQKRHGEQVAKRNEVAVEWGFPEYDPGAPITGEPLSPIEGAQTLRDAELGEASAKAMKTKEEMDTEIRRQELLQHLQNQEIGEAQEAPIQAALEVADVSNLVGGADFPERLPNLSAWVDAVEQERKVRENPPAPLRTKGQPSANVPPAQGGKSTMALETTSVSKALRELEILHQERDQVLQQTLADIRRATPQDRMAGFEEWQAGEKTKWELAKKFEREQFMAKIQEAVTRGITDGPAILEFARAQTDLRPLGAWAKNMKGESTNAVNQGKVQAEVAPQTVSPARLTAEIESEPGYVYHATNAERMEEIRNTGKLIPHRPDYGTEQDTWPDGATEKRSYFSRKANVVWQFAPEEGQPVVLRTKESPEFKTESTGDVFSRKPIQTQDLEYLGEDGNWHALSPKPVKPSNRKGERPSSSDRAETGGKVEAEVTTPISENTLADALGGFQPEIEDRVLSELRKVSPKEADRFAKIAAWFADPNAGLHPDIADEAFLTFEAALDHFARLLNVPRSAHLPSTEATKARMEAEANKGRLLGDKRTGGTDLIDPVAVNAFIDKLGSTWLGTKLESAYRSAVDFVRRGLDYFTWAKDSVFKFGTDFMNSAREIWRSAVAALKAFVSVPGGLVAQRRGAIGSPNLSLGRAAELATPLPPTEEQLRSIRTEGESLKKVEQQKALDEGASEDTSRTKYVEFNGRVENMLRDYGDTKMIADILKAINLTDVRTQMAGATPGRLTRLANAGLLPKPGKLSWAAQDALGQWYGRPVDEILTRKAGENLSLIDQAKLELVLGKVTDMLGRVRKQTDNAPNDLDARAAEQFLLDTDAAIASVMVGNKSDAGRALNAAKRIALPERNSLRLKHELNLRNGELTKTQIDLLNKLDKNSPNFVRNIARITQITWWDKLYEFYLGNILSGLATNTRNLVSNIASLVAHPIEALVARGIDGITGAKHGRSFHDPVAIMLGWAKAFNDAGKVAMEAFIEGDVDTLKLDNEAVRRLYANGESLHSVKGEGLKKALEGKFGYFVRLPSNILRACDAFFRTLASMGYLNMKVMRDARAAGLEPNTTKWNEFVTRNMTEPTEENLKAAAKEGAYRVFASTINNEFINKMYAARGTQTFLGRLSSLFMPFIKTPYNIFVQGLERSPVGLYWLKQGKQMGTISEEQVADELAKPVIGSIILGMGAVAVLQGVLTGGGPKDKGERERLLASGWRPYSARIGKVQIGLDSIEPLLGTTLAMVADATEALMRAPKDKGMEETIRAGVTGTLEAILKNLHNKTFLRGLMSATDAMSDPERYGGSFLESYARGMVPFSGFTKSVANMIDPTIYRVDSPTDSAMNVFPMLSSLGILPKLLPQLDWLGRTQLRQPSGPGIAAALYRGAGPMSYSEMSDDPVDVFANAIGIDKGRPSQHVRWKGQEINLPSALHNEYVRVQGQYTYRYLASVARNILPRISTIPEAGKTRLKEGVEKKISSYRQKVLNQLIIKWKKEGLLK